jgi:DNA replication licensing factor MCM4
VTEQDVKDSIQLLRDALQQAATDPMTGHIDLNLINTGQSSMSRQKSSDLAKYVRPRYIRPCRLFLDLTI